MISKHTPIADTHNLCPASKADLLAKLHFRTSNHATINHTSRNRLPKCDGIIEIGDRVLKMLLNFWSCGKLW